MNKCPCKECISYAMCINKIIIRCSILYKHYVKHCVNKSLSRKESMLRSYADFFKREHYSVSIEREVVIFDKRDYGFIKENINVRYKI